MTLQQLLVLVDRHRLATASSSPPNVDAPPDTGIGVLGMAAMGRI